MTADTQVAAVTARLIAAGLTPADANLAAHAEGITITLTPTPATTERPTGRVADLLAAGNCHSLTLRDGRWILDGHDVTSEYATSA